MRRSLRALRLAALAPAIIAASLCVSCGGGGGGGSTPPPTPPPTPLPPPPPGPGSAFTVRFTDVTPDSGIRYQHAYVNPTPSSETEEFGGGVAAGDYDGDGLVDLFVLRGDVGNNLLYRNLGNNVFRDMSHDAGVAHTKTNGENHRHSGPAFADMDGDGDLDLFVGGIEHDPSFLFRNDGDGTFTDVTRGSGVDTVASKQTLSAGFGDYDLDGDLDIYHTNGWLEPFEPSNLHEDKSRFFHAHGDGTFTEEAEAAGIADSELGHGIVCADFDDDGDIDIFQTHLNEENSATLWRNDTPSGNYLKVKLNGRPPNTQAAGARIRVTVDGTEQLREIHIGSNFTSQNPHRSDIRVGRCDPSRHPGGRVARRW